MSNPCTFKVIADLESIGSTVSQNKLLPFSLNPLVFPGSSFEGRLAIFLSKFSELRWHSKRNTCLYESRCVTVRVTNDYREIVATLVSKISKILKASTNCIKLMSKNGGHGRFSLSLDQPRSQRGCSGSYGASRPQSHIHEPISVAVIRFIL